MITTITLSQVLPSLSNLTLGIKHFHGNRISTNQFISICRKMDTWLFKLFKIMVIILWLITKIPMEYVCDCNFPLSLYYFIFQHENKVKTVKPYEPNNHEWEMQYICFTYICFFPSFYITARKQCQWSFKFAAVPNVMHQQILHMFQPK